MTLVSIWINLRGKLKIIKDNKMNSVFIQISNLFINNLRRFYIYCININYA